MGENSDSDSWLGDPRLDYDLGSKAQPVLLPCCYRDTNTSSTPIWDADISASIATLYAVKMGVG